MRAGLGAICLAGAALCGAGRADGLEAPVASAHFQKAHQEALSGSYKQAQQRLEWLLVQDATDPQRSRAYQVALTKLLRTRPLSFSLTVGLAVASNAKRSSTADVFETELGRFVISDDDEQGTGLGLSISTGATWRHAYDVGRVVEARFGLSGLHHEFESLRFAKPEISLGHRWYEAGAIYSLSVFQNAVIYPDIAGREDPDFRTWGIRADLRRNLGQGRSVTGFARASDRDYAERSYLTGQTYALGASLRLPSGERGKLTLSGQLERANLTAGHFSYGAMTLGLAYGQTTEGGLSWTLGAGQTWRDYDDLFTAVSYAREDRETRVYLSLSHEKVHFKELQPRLKCSYGKQRSNVALYQTDGAECSVEISRQF